MRTQRSNPSARRILQPTKWSKKNERSDASCARGVATHVGNPETTRQGRVKRGSIFLTIFVSHGTKDFLSLHQ